MHVAASGPARDLLGHARAVPLDDTIVVGFEAALLAGADREGVRALVLFGPQQGPGSDSHAGAAALRAAAPLLPDIGLDGLDLEGELAGIETALRNEITRAMRGRRESALRGYA